MHKQEKGVLDREIRNISKDTSIEEEKRGDLRGIFVHKFRIKAAEYLLAIRMVAEDLELIMMGPHEDYYRDLTKYLKNR
jgi:mRNA interferase RelE/StbE